MPAVSVIIPAFQASRWIAETLDSVFAQTTRDFEIIVVNDGSPDTDQLEHVLDGYASRLTYIRKENGGPASARNVGIRAATGEYLAFLDADDVWLPDYLSAQLQFLQGTPPWDLVYTDAEFFGAQELAGRRYMELIPSKGPVSLRALLMESCSIPTSFTVVRRQPVLAAGLFDESFCGAEDFDLWARLLLDGYRANYQKRVLGKRRIHPGNLSADGISVLLQDIRVCQKLAGLPCCSSDIRPTLQSAMNGFQAQIDLERGKRHLLDGSYDAAQAELMRSCRVTGNRKVHFVVACLRLSPRVARLLARLWLRGRVPKLALH